MPPGPVVSRPGDPPPLWTDGRGGGTVENRSTELRPSGAPDQRVRLVLAKLADLAPDALAAAEGHRAEAEFGHEQGAVTDGQSVSTAPYP